VFQGGRRGGGGEESLVSGGIVMRKGWITALVCGTVAAWLAVPVYAQSASDDRQDQSQSSDNDNSANHQDRNQSQQDRSSGRDQSRGSSDTGVRGFIKRHDRDDDGYLSRRELPDDMRQDFDKLDRDGDGYLSRKELQQHAREAQRSAAKPVEVAYLWIIDANAGNVDLNDLQDAYQELQKIDRDNDGKISRSELMARREHVASQWCDKCFDRMDEDKDGELSQSEAKDTTFSEQFSDFDRNSDGYLTKSEIHRKLQEEFESQSASRDSSDNTRR
jgi:Ca2+-binding EF-hand superfamily protein